MEPLPESRAAARYLDDVEAGRDALQLLQSVSDRAEALVPDLVGVSVTVVVDGRPYTLTSTGEQLRVLDAAQYLDGGPCAEVAGHGEVLEVRDVLDEEAWRTFATLSAAAGVRSSLSLPMHSHGGALTGAINLYASVAGAFADHRQELATTFGASIDSLVADADLAFDTRRQAEELPGQLSEDTATGQVLGMLVVNHGWSVQEAGRRLADAAERARVPQSRLVKALLTLVEP